jgi:hypothetical protein
MTYPNDGNRNDNLNRENKTNYMPWIIGVAAVAVVMGIYAMMSNPTPNTADVKIDREVTKTTPAVPAPSAPNPASPNNPTR